MGTGDPRRTADALEQARGLVHRARNQLALVVGYGEILGRRAQGEDAELMGEMAAAAKVAAELIGAVEELLVAAGGSAGSPAAGTMGAPDPTAG